MLHSWPVYYMRRQIAECTAKCQREVKPLPIASARAQVNHIGSCGGEADIVHAHHREEERKAVNVRGTGIWSGKVLVQEWCDPQSDGSGQLAALAWCRVW